MGDVTRRNWLQLAAGGIVAAGGLGSLGWWGLSNGAKPGAPTPTEMVELLAHPDAHKDTIAITVELLRQGVSPMALLDVAFHAPILNASDRGDVHGVLAADAVRVLTQTGTAEERLLPLFWIMSFVSEWVRDETLEPLTQPVSFASEERARERLSRALDDNDTDGAESASVALVRHVGLSKTVDALALGGCAAFTDVHRMIYVAQGARGLAVFGSRHVEPVVRSIARYLARSAMPRAANPFFTYNSTLMDGPVNDTLANDVNTTHGLWSHLRESRGENEHIGGVIAEMLESPVSSGTVWDAIILTALESLLADTSASGLGVHLTTLVDAFAFAYGHTTNPREKRLLMMQGAAWAATLSQVTQPLDTLTPLEAPKDLKDLRNSGDAIYQRALGWAENADGRAVLMRHVISAAINHAGDVHAFKVVAAALALLERLSPDWQPMLCAVLVSTHGWRTEQPWSQLSEARRAIQRLALS